MSWLKKFGKKVSKSVRRMAHGKFHLNPLRNGIWKSTAPVFDMGGYYGYRLLSRHQQHRLAKAIDWGRFKKKYLKKYLSSGNNSASAVFYDSGSGYVPTGYTYHGRTLSQMTGGY